MQGHADVIELLNEVLTAELTAVNQYFLDAKMLSNWGYERLGSKFRDESIDEMKDADKLIESQATELAETKLLTRDIAPNGSRGDEALPPRTAHVTTEMLPEIHEAVR